MRFLFILFTVILMQAHCEPHQFSVEPMAYHVKREKLGGAWQKGILYGIEGRYERLCNWGIYLAIDGYYAQGKIKGKSGGGSSLVSDLSDSEVQGKIGYTLAFGKGCWCPSITPFIGYGYFSSRNNFRDPSPLPIHFHNTFDFGSAGVMVTVPIKSCLSLGVTFTAKWMIEGKSKTTNDPFFEDATLMMESKTQYEVDIPLYYTHESYPCLQWGVAFIYIQRNYGGRENFPFDFITTKYNNYGGKLSLIWSF